MEKRKVKVGDTVYLKPIPLSNAIRRNPNVITKEVTKVGNKYVYVGTLKFLKENGEQVTIYSGDYQLFYNKEDLDDIVEREELLKEFQTFGTILW